ncbi:MAG: hypothetical protein KGJ13_04875, partial [Patescibacteria group bacterium]|nr:hypothetical protein [Patescibacteria group bacterium]
MNNPYFIDVFIFDKHFCFTSLFVAKHRSFSILSVCRQTSLVFFVLFATKHPISQFYMFAAKHPYFFRLLRIIL